MANLAARSLTDQATLRRCPMVTLVPVTPLASVLSDRASDITGATLCFRQCVVLVVSMTSA
ncbi:hypothetical protein RB11704 [Rhodopirellula baltica SH 1]|uniref:Uncharacterized protein n=1 Tax=Rhodopirellula baltica (strain DSM 10527 / NCIMB 13988 / SH1) TaxID=243090 RepID=Q7UDY1_RHOBA|nr:hypothetical protein RB11704 [Rhodopirellula baltica SH 1]